MSGQVPWIVFDADNTLWDVEALYNDARSEMCKFLAGHGLDATEVEKFQQLRDKELYSTYGYSACRFARSFEDTALHFLPDAAHEIVRHVRRLASDVFEKPAAIADGLGVLLDRLIAAKYSIAIITAGERWVQERRLSDFHLRDKFHAVEIVETKTKSVFDDFAEKRRAQKAASWVVGDSLKSDVLPARAAGLNAVLLQATNWSHIEAHGHEIPKGTPTIKRLTDLPKVLGVA